MKKILFIGKTYPEDRTAWSGTIYQTIQGLKRAGYEVDYLKADRDFLQSFWSKLLVTYWLRIPRLLGKNIRMDESFYDVWRYKSTFANIDFSAYDTGGTENYVVNGENGYLLPLNSGGGTFAHSIIESIRKQELDKLSRGAVKRYKEHLNWRVWSAKVREALNSLE